MPFNPIKTVYSMVTGSSPKQTQASDIYDKIAVQSRNKEFFTTYMIPDTIEGRFEMLTLHLFLYLQRLKAEERSHEEIGKLVLETFFSDLDGALREIGTGDLAVPKKMKKLVNSFYVRVYAYSEALESGSDENLVKELQDNIYSYLHEDSDNKAGPHILEALAAYVKKSYEELATVPLEDFLTGELKFITPEIK